MNWVPHHSQHCLCTKMTVTHHSCKPQSPSLQHIATCSMSYDCSCMVIRLDSRSNTLSKTIHFYGFFGCMIHHCTGYIAQALAVLIQRGTRPLNAHNAYASHIHAKFKHPLVRHCVSYCHPRRCCCHTVAAWHHQAPVTPLEWMPLWWLRNLADLTPHCLRISFTLDSGAYLPKQPGQ